MYYYFFQVVYNWFFVVDVVQSRGVFLFQGNVIFVVQQAKKVQLILGSINKVFVFHLLFFSCSNHIIYCILVLRTLGIIKNI